MLLLDHRPVLLSAGAGRGWEVAEAGQQALLAVTEDIARWQRL